MLVKLTIHVSPTHSDYGGRQMIAEWSLDKHSQIQQHGSSQRQKPVQASMQQDDDIIVL
jgi:hypothetical protein